MHVCFVSIHSFAPMPVHWFHLQVKRTYHMWSDIRTAFLLHWYPTIYPFHVPKHTLDSAVFITCIDDACKLWTHVKNKQKKNTVKAQYFSLLYSVRWCCVFWWTRRASIFSSVASTLMCGFEHIRLPNTFIEGMKVSVSQWAPFWFHMIKSFFIRFKKWWVFHLAK